MGVWGGGLNISGGDLSPQSRRFIKIFPCNLEPISGFRVNVEFR